MAFDTAERIAIVSKLLSKILKHGEQVRSQRICELAHTASLVLTADEWFLQNNVEQIMRDTL